MIPEIAVLTGGPGCGKTTLLNALAGLGETTIPEAALQLIDELNAELGTEGQRQWRTRNFAEFQMRLIERQLKLESNVRTGASAIADRGLLDIVGFCRFKRVPSPHELTPELLKNRYSMAFLLDPLPVFEDRQRTGRIFTQEESLVISDSLESVYSEAGVPVVRVPFSIVAERAAFVLKHLPSRMRHSSHDSVEISNQNPC